MQRPQVLMRSIASARVIVASISSHAVTLPPKVFDISAELILIQTFLVGLLSTVNQVLVGHEEGTGEVGCLGESTCQCLEQLDAHPTVVERVVAD